MEHRPYVKYSNDLEKIPDGEAEDIQAVAKQLTDIQKAQYNVHRHCFSGTHARTQGIVKGKFIVPDDLPQHLKQGELFAKGGEYPLAARYSTEPGDPSLDVSLPRLCKAALHMMSSQLKLLSGPRACTKRLCHETFQCAGRLLF